MREVYWRRRKGGWRRDLESGWRHDSRVKKADHRRGNVVEGAKRSCGVCARKEVEQVRLGQQHARGKRLCWRMQSAWLSSRRRRGAAAGQGVLRAAGRDIELVKARDETDRQREMERERERKTDRAVQWAPTVGGAVVTGRDALRACHDGFGPYACPPVSPWRRGESCRAGCSSGVPR